MSIIRDIVITDEDIDWVEKIMGEDITFDSERRSIIKNLESKDIQAFPGSGKTTVLVAKLAILAKKWDLPTSGICVLSHTNVAREEIEKRLGNTSVGAKLLKYPHFIGTVHSFFTTYIASPWVKSHGKKIEIIETDLTTAYRWNKILPFYKDIFEKKFITENNCSYKGAIGTLELGNYKPNSKPYEYVKNIVDSSQKSGYFTFDEMLLFAKEALEGAPSISKITSKRFPIVFIDEAQDTNDFQYNLIDKCFNESIQQGFGDENQAIYNYVGENNSVRFPKSNPLIIQQSKRFSNNIANLANPLAISKSNMVGVNNEFNKSRHSIFVFKKDKIEDVLKEYGKLILETFTAQELERYHSDGCYAVGLVHNKKAETKEEHYPKGVYDYWSAYKSKPASKGYKPKYLIEYFRMGSQELLSNRDVYKQITWLLSGLREVINEKKNGIYIHNRTNLMKSFLDCLENEEDTPIFRQCMVNLQKSKLNTKNDWEKALKHINLLLDLFDIKISNSGFSKWISPEVISLESDDSVKDYSTNTFNYISGNRKVTISLDSIHGVKGKTHLSTLVLETFRQSHRLKSILPFLYDKKGKKKVPESKFDNLKCHYVAMTRPRGLLCLAIPFDKISSTEIGKLQEAGWNIVFI